MGYTADEVLQFVEENDVKFIRLAFCDIYGHQKNMAIMSGELAKAMTEGVPFAADNVEGFMRRKESDLVLIPDPNTLTVLPWRPSNGSVVRLFCDIHYPDGAVFEGDGRAILKKAVARARTMGLIPMIGAECEFYLFQLDQNGEPTMVPQDHAGYLDIAPLDKGENVRREICLTLEEMGIEPTISRHQNGPGQNEICFRYKNALRTADNIIHFASVVKTTAYRNGLCASFMPKPFLSESGSSLHINVSLTKDGENLFDPDNPDKALASSFVEGVLERVKEMTLFLNPITNSYRRLGEYQAPGYISWSRRNISQLIRIPVMKNGQESRMELRSPDMACNPYIAISLVLNAGLDGIEKGLKLREPFDEDLADSSRPAVPMLPRSLHEAVRCAQGSEFLKTYIPDNILRYFIQIKKMQAEQYDMAEDKERLERDLYFQRV